MSITHGVASGGGGSVDVISVPVPLSTIGGGTEAAALRVTIANDSTGLLSIDDNGGSLTVDGTVALSAGSAVIGHVIADSGSTTVVTGNVTVVQSTGTNLHVVVDSGTITTDTEFPAAAASSDNFANPTTTNVMSMGMLYDGATWDRAKGDSTDGALVNLGTNNDVTVTGSVTANAGTNLNTSLLALDSTVAKDASLTTLNTSVNTLLKPANTLAAVTTVSTVTSLTQMNGAAISMNTGVRDAGTQRVTIATNDVVPVTLTSTTITGTVAATQSGTWTVQPGNTANTTAWLVGTKTDLAPSSPTATSVGVASAQAVAANASRKGLVLVNTSNASISLGFGSAAVLNSGVTLRPDGVFEMDEYTFDLGAVNAIASAAASNLAVQEYA